MNEVNFGKLFSWWMQIVVIFGAVGVAIICIALWMLGKWMGVF